MGTRKNQKSRKIFRKTRSKKQRGGGNTCSRPGLCTTDQNNIEEEDPNTKDEYLEIAIEEETPVRVKEYLDEGANPNITILDENQFLLEPQRIPAILYAARHITPSTTIMKHLLNAGASVEQNHYTGTTENNTTTPLIEAAEYGNLSAVRFLLDKGVNINATTGSGVPAIAYTVLNEDIPMIRLMLDKRKGEIDLNYIVFDTDNENVIDDAAENAINPEVAKILKKYAIEQKLPIVLERQKDRTKLSWALRKKDVGNRGDGTMPYDLRHKIGEYLGGGKRKTRSKKQRGGVRNINGELIDASSYGYPKIVKNLLDEGADVNALDGQNHPALFWASFNGHAKVVEILLDYGADVTMEDVWGRTSLYWANFNRHKKVVELLNLHIERQRQQDKKNAADLFSKLDVGNRGDGTMPLDLRRKIDGYLGGKRKSKKSKKEFRKNRKTRSKKQRGGETPGSWVLFNNINDDLCTICQEPLKNSDSILEKGPVYQLNCGHQFHNNCLNGWCNNQITIAKKKSVTGITDEKTRNNKLFNRKPAFFKCPVCNQETLSEEHNCLSMQAYQENFLDNKEKFDTFEYTGIKTNKPTIFSRLFSRKGGTKSKRVVFKYCESDVECPMEALTCDTKNNICVQKYDVIGGKTRKKMKKRCTIDNNIIY